jgi:hypothetical protein
LRHIAFKGTVFTWKYMRRYITLIHLSVESMFASMSDWPLLAVVRR